MATATKTKETSKTEGLVDVYIERGQQNDDPNLLVSVNGVNYLLPKGKTSKVPPVVAYEIERAKRATEAYFQKRDEMLSASQEQK